MLKFENSPIGKWLDSLKEFQIIVVKFLNKNAPVVSG